MRVRLIKPPSIQYYHPRNAYALGLLYIGAVLEEEGHDVWAYDLVNMPLKKSLEKAKQIIRQKPDVLGINCDSHNRYACFKIAQLAKRICPNTKIVVGGLHASYYYNEILKRIPQIDIIILGEAEFAFRDILEKKPEEVPGIAYRKNGRITVTAKRNRIEDLDKLPIPKHEYYNRFIRKYKEAYINSSRGCPAKCRFCSPLGYWGGFRSRSPVSVLKEIDYLLKQFPTLKFIYFQEQCFTYDKQRVIGICKGLIKRGSPVKWACETRVDHVDREMLEYMKKAGCTEIDYGIESGSEEIFKSLCKGFTLQHCEDAFRETYLAEINLCAYLIVGSPGENSRTLAKTRSFLARNKKYITEIQLSYYYVYPWSILYKKLFNDRIYWFKNLRAPIYLYKNSFLRTWIEIERMRFFFIFSKGSAYFIKRIVRILQKKKYNYYKDSLLLKKLFGILN